MSLIVRHWKLLIVPLVTVVVFEVIAPGSVTDAVAPIANLLFDRLGELVAVFEDSPR